MDTNNAFPCVLTAMNGYTPNFIDGVNSQNGMSFRTRKQNKPKRTNRLTMSKRVKLRHKRQNKNK